MKRTGSKRREFLKTAVGTAAWGGLSRRLLGSGGKDRPNLLVIMTDQQFADVMSCVIGHDHLHTPNMDSLAAEGMRFRRAYTANPLCVPARCSLFTGRYPHETGIQTNTTEMIDPERFPCMGRVFKGAGYETGFFGKWHMPFRVDRTEEHGFDEYVGEPALYDGAYASRFISRRHERPFLAVVSFLNPHNICEWSRGQELPGGPIGEPPSAENCPPLKPNMAPPVNETDIMAHMRRSYQAHRLFPVGDFTDEKWRQYLWAYYRLTEKVDQKIGVVLEALRESGQEENTVVVFLSDHGECHGTHRWNQKTVFYEESSRVPLIITQKGKTQAGVCDALVQTGVDLIPTLCDFAGISKPAGLPGASLHDWAIGESRAAVARPYVVVSNRMVQCEPVNGRLLQPDGRMVRGRRYKYCLYSLGQPREEFFDLTVDPGETVNLAGEPRALAVLSEHRRLLAEFARKNQDPVALSMLAGIRSLT